MPELRKDDEFVESYGYPISKNSVGVKLSTDQKEIKEYIEAETGRFLKGLANLSPAKRYYNHLVDNTNYNIEFFESTQSILEQENHPSQDGIESAGEVALE